MTSVNLKSEAIIQKPPMFIEDFCWLSDRVPDILLGNFGGSFGSRF